MKLNEQQKLSEQHANEMFTPMLSEGEELLCIVYCAFGQKEFSAPTGDILAGYAACTSGGRLLLAIYSSMCYSFNGVKTETYDLSLAKNIKIEKRIIGEYVIKADFTSENGDRKIKIQTAPKVLFNGFPNQKENLEKMLEILHKYEN
ncbi:MAG: hypothetical protein K2N71_02995 [Oscillospiraceae bacterium]|nr:hypothetical protein [Oscillospiraceae bacterium]